MSNVVKLTAKKKTAGIALGIDAWKTQLEENSDRLADRLYDALRLSDEEANDEGIPVEFLDCAVLGVLSSLLVQVTATRNVLSPSGLLKLVKEQIKEEPRE